MRMQSTDDRVIDNSSGTHLGTAYGRRSAMGKLLEKHPYACQGNASDAGERIAVSMFRCSETFAGMHLDVKKVGRVPSKASYAAAGVCARGQILSIRRCFVRR